MSDLQSLPLASEEHLFQRRVIALRSANETSGWFFAMWIGSIVALGTVALVAFTLPETIQRVNDAYQEMPR